jgi:hypothetical protein
MKPGPFLIISEKQKDVEKKECDSSDITKHRLRNVLKRCPVLRENTYFDREKRMGPSIKRHGLLGSKGIPFL